MNMKKITMTLVAVLCCAVCTHAQENKDYEVTISPFFVTEFLLDEKNLYPVNSKEWTGEGLHAGYQLAGMEIAIERNNKIPEVPENPLLEISLTDAYDKVAFIEKNTEYITDVFEIELPFTRHFHDKHTLGVDLKCGGEYTYRVAVPGLDYLYEEKVVVKDEPYARVRYNDVKAGNDLLAVAFFNTGYPYDPTSLSGTEEATMQLFYIDKNEQGEITEVLCEYDPQSRGGDPADGHKVKGATIHWVNAEDCLDAEVRMYDYLFNDPDPDGPGKNFMDAINPDSLTVLKGCKIESTIRDVQMPPANQNSLTYQFIRNGYFCLDNVDSRPDALVFNRSVALKDSFKL